MLERSNVDFPLWRKKVDATFLKEGSTPIPNWLLEAWDIPKSFETVTSKMSSEAQVRIHFGKKSYSGQVSKIKYYKGHRYRLYLDQELTELMRERFLMSYMRALEAELSEGMSHRDIEEEISFWEFIDIEFDSRQKKFKFTSHYQIKPQFPNLFSRLVGSAPLKVIGAQTLDKDNLSIHKQDWAPRESYKFIIGAENVIYMLLDTKNKIIYVGEANNMIKRFNNGHPDIKDWDYFKYNVLPLTLADYRLSIERMVIRDIAALLDNKQSINTFSISEYKLANRKIDK